jgi:DNA invertase Pin-like site-specific DNA recombinase
MGRTEKINATHLKRKAILYIRQSTMRQVVANTESTLRQYALKERLKSLGWDEAMIEIIDCDLGRSGADAERREGFRQMLADVGEGNVGAVASIECSRLSRSSGDWGRLMEICALSNTILIDDDGIYDPNDFNDRLLLGLKGTMSEAELHFLRERMRGGAINKAKRGELRCPLPVGYLYDGAGRIVKDPDIQVQNAINLFFESFRICGTANRVAVYYSKKGYRFPTNKSKGFGKPDIHWNILTSSKAIKVLHASIYAGVYSYGKIKTKHTPKGKKLCQVPEEEWISNIENHHDAYISLEEYRTNVATLRSNNTNKGESPPREGIALGQGIVRCAHCGNKMYTAYDKRGYRRYICNYRHKDEPFLNKYCLSIDGRSVDDTVSSIIIQKLTPEAVKAADDVMRELEKRKQGEDNYFAMQVEKSKYEVELARKRYMNADPENRLVSAELERLWNEKMNRLAQAELELRKYRSSSAIAPDTTNMERLLALPEKLKKAWNDDTLCITDKKRIVRCLVEDITLDKLDGDILVGIRFKGGKTESATVPRPLPYHEMVATDREVIEHITEASKKHYAIEIAEQLNAAGKKTGKGLDFTSRIVRTLQKVYKIPSITMYYHSLGWISAKDKAEQLGISLSGLKWRRKNGRISGSFIRTSEQGDYMYEP